MAAQEITALQSANAGLEALAKRLFDDADGPGGAPYPDGRVLSGLLNEYLPSSPLQVQGSLTADADGAADGVDVLLDFKPKFAFIHNETAGLAYLKLASHAATSALKITLTGPVVAYSATLVKFSDAAAANLNAFHVESAEVTAADVIHYWVVG